jgi:hypothetical protein
MKKLLYIDKIGVHLFTMDNGIATETIENLRDIINSSKFVFTAHYGLQLTAECLPPPISKYHLYYLTH